MHVRAAEPKEGRTEKKRRSNEQLQYTGVFKELTLQTPYDAYDPWAASEHKRMYLSTSRK